MKTLVKSLLFVLLISTIFSCKKKDTDDPCPEPPRDTVFMEDPSKGLVAYYSFNGNANNQNGYANGVVQGAVLTNDRNNQANSAYYFDGFSAIKLPVTNLINANYTYAIWVKPESLPDPVELMAILSTGGPGGDQALALANNYYSNHGYTAITYHYDATNNSAFTNSLPGVNEWVHLASTRSDSTIELYVNGELVKSVSFSDRPAGYTSPSSAFVGSRWNQSQYFIGIIDEVRIYNKALSADEIKDLM